MSRRTKGRNVVYLCGGDLKPGLRGTECPNALHDYPLPSGYVDAFEVAGHRLYKRWTNIQCRECNQYGWTPGAHICPECGVAGDTE